MHLTRFLPSLSGRLPLRLGIAALCVAVLPVVNSTVAQAYSGTGAAQYADKWATSRNSDYPSFSDDCTNFVSQALHSGGGYSYVGQSKSAKNDAYWWAAWKPNAGFSWSNSWSVANDSYIFQLDHIPGAVPEGTASGAATNDYTPDAVKTGDVLYYDWNSDGHMDHATIQVGIGTDPESGWYGNYVDQHSTDHKHEFWSERPRNSKWATTTIYFMHVLPDNT
jgi:hypothetical protein